MLTWLLVKAFVRDGIEHRYQWAPAIIEERLLLRLLGMTFLTKLLGCTLFSVSRQLGMMVYFFRWRTTPFTHPLFQLHKVAVSA
jgi:hypothetical protein